MRTYSSKSCREPWMVRPSQLASVAMRIASRSVSTACGILGADVDVALGGADGDAGDGHAFDEAVRVAFHQHAVGEGAAVALVGVAADVFLVGLGVVHGLPLDAGREAGAAAAAQAGGRDLRDDVERRHGRARW